LILKRVFDVSLALILTLIFILPGLFLCLAIKLTSKGPAIYWSDRLGKGNIIFKMPKFRTMKLDTPPIATHLLKNPKFYLTPIGSFLRKYSIDEIPQLLSILSGQMSFVGPRPALFNQTNLIKMRNRAGISLLTPGLTGWAQVNGRDELDIRKKVNLEVEYIQRQSFIFDLKILWVTFLRVLKKQGISH
jgi:O-antigen biosynthesis protein WbqP